MFNLFIDFQCTHLGDVSKTVSLRDWFLQKLFKKSFY